VQRGFDKTRQRLGRRRWAEGANIARRRCESSNAIVLAHNLCTDIVLIEALNDEFCLAQRQCIVSSDRNK